MKKVIKKKLEETKQHAFEKKVLQREKAKGAPRVGEFYKENDILLENILDLGQIRIDMKREGEDITTEEIIETTKIIALKDHMIEITIYERKDQKDSKEKRKLALFIDGGGFICGDVRTKEISAVILHSSQVRLLSRRNIVWHLKLHIQEQKKTYLERSTG